MAINKFTISLSYTEVERVVSALRKLRNASDHLLRANDDGYLKSREYNSETKEYEDCEPYVENWLVTAAEAEVEARAELAEIISWFTGDAPETETPKALATLQRARKRLDEEVAAKKAATKAEAEVN